MATQNCATDNYPTHPLPQTVPGYHDLPFSQLDSTRQIFH